LRKSPNIEISELDLDQIFSDDHEIAGNRIPKILQIPLDMIDEFPDHPFQVRLDEDMDQLVESIKERGVIIPVTLRKKEDGRYETVSGHRRVKASELAGLDTVPAEIKHGLNLYQRGFPMRWIEHTPHPSGLYADLCI